MKRAVIFPFTNSQENFNTNNALGQTDCQQEYKNAEM